MQQHCHFFLSIVTLLLETWNVNKPTNLMMCIVTDYSGRKKKRAKVFCSHFMSFYPIDFIFIGWVGYDKNLFRVPRNFDSKPTNPIFSPKRQMNHFRKWPFLGVWCRKLTFRENGVMDMANMLDSGQNSPNTTFPNIFSFISAISADLSKSQKNHILKKKSIFLIENRL